jgi:hypothetical protein
MSDTISGTVVARIDPPAVTGDGAQMILPYEKTDGSKEVLAIPFDQLSRLLMFTSASMARASEKRSEGASKEMLFAEEWQIFSTPDKRAYLELKLRGGAEISILLGDNPQQMIKVADLLSGSGVKIEGKATKH